MKAGMKKVIIVSGMVFMLGLWTASCGLNTADFPAEENRSEAEEPEEPEKQDSTADADENETDKNETGGNETDKNDADENGSEEDEADEIEAKQSGTETDEAQDVSTGGWHVLDPETAAAVDADFEGEVWKIDSDSFYIVETETEFSGDGTMAASSPAVGVEIPDSELIRVVFDEDTRFYTRTIYDNGARYEDAEAEFKDLKQYGSVALKGEFKNDIFCADEVRIQLVS